MNHVTVWEGIESVATTLYPIPVCRYFNFKHDDLKPFKENLI